MKDVFTLDLRSLGLFRIGLALCLVADLVLRALDLRFFYTDQGAMPNDMLHVWLTDNPTFSIYALSGDFMVVWLLFVIAFLLAILLLIGYRARLMTVLCWIFLVSLQNRNFLVLQGGDVVLRLALFWAIFLPIGERFSLVRKKEDVVQQHFSGGTVALVVQVFVIYFTAAILKNNPAWTSEFTAVYYAISIDQFATAFSAWIFPYPQVMEFMTAAGFWIEMVAPLLLVIPYKNGLFRLVALASLCLLHLGIASILSIGLFPLMSICMLLPLLPPQFWKHLPAIISYKTR